MAGNVVDRKIAFCFENCLLYSSLHSHCVVKMRVKIEIVQAEEGVEQERKRKSWKRLTSHQ